MTALHYLSLTEVCRKIKSGELTSAAVTEHLLDRIEAEEPRLGAFVTVLAREALRTAAQRDRDRHDGKPLGALHGVPIALKDLLCTRGTATSCGTRVLADWVPDEDATVVTRLKEAGAVLIGKVKLTEGAWALHHPDVEPPKNPWNDAHWTGVSSSGSGVAVAAGLAYGALGTDTGGSIRFPSASCGVVGIKPTYGRVSRFGVFPLAESLDHVGPMARTVEDAAHLLGVLSGPDPRDPTSLHDPVPNYAGSVGDGVTGMRIGVDRAYVENGVASEVVNAVRQALDTFRDLGAIVTEVALPDHRPLVSGWATTCGVECALAHERYFPARRDDYGPAFAAFIDNGRAASALDYARLERHRARFRAGCDAMFEDIDVLIAPCMVSPPPTVEEMNSLPTRDDSVADFITFTAPFDYSGHPSITLPIGLDGDGLPLAFQLIGRHLGEPALIRAGHAFEQANAFRDRPG